MASENLKKLMEEIVETEKLASIDVEECDWRVRPGMSIAKADAKDKLEGLKKRYLDAISGTTFSLFVLGPKAEDFVKVAEAESAAPLLVLRADAIYHRLMERVEETLGANREFGTMQMGMVIRALSELARDLDIKAFDAPKFIESGTLVNTAAVLAHVRRIVREAVGDDFNRIFLTREITRKALEMRYTSTVLPVVVLGLESDDEVSGLNSIAARFGARVVAQDEVTKESVIEVFTEIKEKLKNKKTK